MSSDDEIWQKLNQLIDRDPPLALRIIPLVSIRTTIRVLPIVAWEGHINFWQQEKGDRRVEYLAVVINAVKIFTLLSGDAYEVLFGGRPSLATSSLSSVRQAIEYAQNAASSRTSLTDTKNGAYEALSAARSLEGSLLAISRAADLDGNGGAQSSAKYAASALLGEGTLPHPRWLDPRINSDIYTALNCDIDDLSNLSLESIGDFLNSPVWQEIPEWYVESVNKLIDVVDSLDRSKGQEREWETIERGIHFLKVQAGYYPNSSRRTQSSGIFQPEKPSMVDSLNRQSLAEALAKNLVHKKNNDSRTIGLLGDWGSGKTTFVNMLKNELIKSDSAQPFIFGDFNAWSYEHTDNIQAGIAQELIKALTSSPDFSNKPVTLEKGEPAEDLVMPPSGVWGSIKSFMCASVDYLFINLSWAIVFDLVRKAPKKLHVMVRRISDAISYFFKITKRHLTDIKTLRILVYLLFFSIPWTYSFLSGFLDFSFELSFAGQMKSVWAACFFALGVCNIIANKASFLKSWISSSAASFFGRLKRVPLWSGLTLGWALERLKLTALFSVKAHPFQLIKITFLVLLAIAPLISGFLENHHAAKWLWVIGFGAIWFREVGKIVMNPLAKELMTYLRLPSYAKHLGEIPVMRENINLLCKLRLKEKNGKTPRLLFVVDDLDRCSHSGIVKVFEAVRLVLDIENVIVIIAVDQHVALAALALHYAELSDHHKSRSSHVIARDYLAKVIHMPITLRKPSTNEVEVYLRRLWPVEYSDDPAPSHIPPEKEPVPDNPFDPKPIPKKIIDPVVFDPPTEEVLAFSDTYKAAFIYWINFFELANSRQLKRLDNCYDLLRSYVPEMDVESFEIKISAEKSKPAYPMMLTLILMEYLNSMDDTQVRECLWRDLFFTEKEYSWVVHEFINKDFIDSYRSQRNLMPALRSQVESFVLPAVG